MSKCSVVDMRASFEVNTIDFDLIARILNWPILHRASFCNETNNNFFCPHSHSLSACFHCCCCVWANYILFIITYFLFHIIIYIKIPLFLRHLHRQSQCTLKRHSVFNCLYHILVIHNVSTKSNQIFQPFLLDT